MVNLKVERIRAKESAGEETNALRAGRISNVERLSILTALGKYAQKRYNEYVTNNRYGYNLKLLKGALQFVPDVDAFENEYFVDTGSRKLNSIAAYFENGTGLYNTKYKHTGRARIEPGTGKMLLYFRKPWHGIKAMASVRGVRPVFMLKRTMKSIEFNRAVLQRQIRINLGI